MKLEDLAAGHAFQNTTAHATPEDLPRQRFFQTRRRRSSPMIVSPATRRKCLWWNVTFARRPAPALAGSLWLAVSLRSAGRVGVSIPTESDLLSVRRRAFRPRGMIENAPAEWRRTER
jgi:hypothetical protein